MEAMYSVFSAVLVIGLLLACLAFLRRKGIAQMNVFGPNRQAGKNLEVLDRLILTPQHSLHLVRVANDQLLIGLSPSGCSLLRTAPAEVRREAGQG